jgi:hypothetical protein
MLQQKIEERVTDPPEAATSLTAFHKKNWTNFVGMCPRPWAELSFAEKKNVVRRFYFRKFTLCPRETCMLPCVGQKRVQKNNARWPGFYLTEVEFNKLIDDIMTEYAMIK